MVLSVRSSLSPIITTNTPSPDLLAAASTLQACLGFREAEPEVSTMMTLYGNHSTESGQEGMKLENFNRGKEGFYKNCLKFRFTYAF